MPKQKQKSVPSLSFFVATATIVFAMVSAASIVQPSGLVYAQQETKGDSWNSIKTALDEVESLTGNNASQSALSKLDQAKATYDSVFRPAAAELDPETEQLVEDAFAEIRTAVQQNNAFGVTLHKQTVDKTIYKIAFMKIEEELFEEKVDEAAEWFTVMAKKFKYDQTPSEASAAMAELEVNPGRVEELTPVILDDLRNTFLLKVREEITVAIEALSKEPADNASAQKFAMEGIAYYRTIQPDVKAKIGEQSEVLLYSELQEFFESAQAGNLEKMKDEAEEITEILASYEGKESSGLGAAISEIIDLLTLVNREYVDAVRDGEVIDEEEYDEATIFITKAIEKFDASKVEAAEVASEEVAEVEEELENLASLIQNKADPAQISDSVLFLQAELKEILSAAGAGGEVQSIGGWEYIERINELLDSAVEEYKEGEYEQARSLAREAYIDNYEFIEPDIAEDDRELMEKIEVAMRIDLVKMIDDRRSASEIESHVEMIKTDLETTRAIVTPEFPASIAIVAAASLVGVIVVMSRIRAPIFSSNGFPA